LIQEKSPRLGIFIWFLLAMFLYVTLEVSVGSWLPTYLESTFALSSASASMHLTLYWTGLATTRFIYIFVHSGSIRRQILLHMMGIILSFLYLFFVDSSTLGRALMIFILGLSCGPVWPLIVNLYSKMYSHKNYVMYLVSAGSMGALVGIFLTSTIIESQGVGSLMATTTVYGSLLIATYMVLLAKTKQRNKISL
jgi:fucose permease